MKKLAGYEVDTWELTAHEVEVLTDAADQRDEGKKDIFLDFDDIQEQNIFSYYASESRSAFEKWLFCNGSELEIKKRWHGFLESVSA